jgi:hypothetical protein
MAPGRVYVMNLNGANTDHPGMLGSNGNFMPQAGFLVPGQHSPGGPLYFLPHVRLDVEAARAELKQHHSQLEQCMQSADKAMASPRSPGGDLGFAQVDFTSAR